ncbi:MAG: dienelactone hydrolase [Alphaproteobacteria bacterium]|nr:dienelactone hydrolase [Alphaproteobacteria bacterium]
MRLVIVTLMAMLLAAPAGAVGFETATVPDPGDQPLEVGIWYPSKAPSSAQPLGLFTQTVAANAQLSGNGLPLILISHGSGGSFEGHYDTALALAQAGFVVASVTHTGNNYRDDSRFSHVADRPRHIIRVLDYMLGAWPAHGQIDRARIGVFGFSAGGFTALVLIGGVPDLSRERVFCAAHEKDDWTCGQLRARNIPLTPPTASVWLHDERIRAAVIAAPALGTTFTPAGLANVTVPIQLWRAADDHILAHPYYAQAVYDALPTKPDYRVVAHADHFDFLAPCSDRLAHYVPAICKSESGFDRAAFHRGFDAAIVAFFEKQLPRK